MTCNGHADEVDGQKVTCKYCRHVDAREAKLSAAYAEAIAACHGWSVHLSVSKEVWDYLMSIRVMHDVDKPWLGGKFVTGFSADWLSQVPIICDTSSHQPEGFSVVVVARKVIA